MKSLELTIYPFVDRWVDYTCDIGGRTVSGSSREYGYETPHGVWRGDEFEEKRLTDAELAAEYWRTGQDEAYITEGIIWKGICDGWSTSESAALHRSYVIRRFATLPHYDEEQS